MNKKESLSFLQSCIDKVNAATAEDIGVFRENYELNCNVSTVNSSFEFVMPVGENIVTCDKIDEKMSMILQEAECFKKGIFENLEYTFIGIEVANQQSNTELALAA